jgi:hypothetical protein
VTLLRTRTHTSGISRPSSSRLRITLSHSCAELAPGHGATSSTQQCTQCPFAAPKFNFAVDTLSPRLDRAVSPTTAPFRVETLTAPTCKHSTTPFNSTAIRKSWPWSDRRALWERPLSRLAARWTAMVCHGLFPRTLFVGSRTTPPYDMRHLTLRCPRRSLSLQRRWWHLPEKQ